MNTFRQRLDKPGPVILDGGLATQLEAMGFDIGGHLWSASMLRRQPRAIVDAHIAFLKAGAECIITASYQASREGFMALGLDAPKADRLIASSVELAKEARREYLAGNPPSPDAPLVAASIGPYGATQQDGSEYTGRYNIDAAGLRAFHAPRLRLLDSAGADVLAVETIPNIEEAGILAELLLQTETPAWVSFCCRDKQSISDGTSLRVAAALFADHPGVEALGINCTAPGLISALIPEIRRVAPAKAIVVYPNSGERYHVENNRWSGDACDFERDFDVRAWRRAGAKLIGGCCRTGPGHISGMRSML
jgi:homocysteine S-methyltransferase